MRLAPLAIGVALIAGLTFGSASAAPKGGGPKPASAKAPKVTNAKPSSTKAPKVTTTTKTTKAPTVGKTRRAATVRAKSTKADVRVAKMDAKPAKAKPGRTTLASTGATSTASAVSTTTSPSGTGTTTNAIDFTKGRVAEKLASSTNLRTKIESRLQTVGYDGSVYQAAYGFKNLGQFVAATNVSRNTGASFEQLKIQMTGLSVNADGTVLKANVGADGTVTMVTPENLVTPAPTKSLGQAIKTVNSGVDATAAALTASQADAELATAQASK